MPNKLSQFWQELKRRNVVRVVTVYAGAAFVIIELINNITEPLHLPEWTPTLVIILLAIGFPVVIIFSWIYDVHPEKGMVKTEPVHKVKQEDIPKSSNSWKIASYISFVVVVGLIVLNIIPRGGTKQILDKSIAVLPFRNDSPDEEKMYFINGTMEAILDNLCKIEDLKVPGRTSVEQYRDVAKPVPEIAEELMVSYILEGSGQKIGNRVLLTVQLLDGVAGHHIWSKQYDREIREVEDLIDIQAEIARLVAGEIEAIITPEEKQLIEMIPTTNLTAFDYYQQGREEYLVYHMNGEQKALERAEELYHQALLNDPTFARAYIGLADVYWTKNYVETYLSEDYMDSVLVLADIALSYDDKLAAAYAYRGNFFNLTGDPEKALREFNKAIGLNPNDWYGYSLMGEIYYYSDKVKAIESLHKAASLNRGPDLDNLLESLGKIYYSVGMFEKAAYYYLEAFKLNGDSTTYYQSLLLSDHYDYQKAIERNQRVYAFDSTNYDALYYVGYNYMFLDQFEESLKYFQRWITKDKVREVHTIEGSSHRIGYALYKNGYTDEAEQYFEKQLEYGYRTIELGRPYAHRDLYAYYDLAAVYAFRGDKEKAFENLRIFDQKKIFEAWMIKLIHDDPLLNPIREEPEFQQIMADVEAKYQAEYERVRQWLEENAML